MKLTRRRITALLPFCLMAVLVAACVLCLRAQQRQYALNRALIAALAKGDATQELMLVNAGADPNARYSLASIPSFPELFKHIRHMSIPAAKHSRTAFEIVCGDESQYQWHAFASMAVLTRDYAPLVEAMLRHGAKVNEQGTDGWPPLQYAILAVKPNTVQVLIENGADINSKVYDGETALNFAVTFAAPSEPGCKGSNIVRQLLDHGANPNVPDVFGHTPLWMADSGHCANLAALLRHYGAGK